MGVPADALSDAETRALCRLAGFMVPASAEHGMPGADDAVIASDIVRSLDRDLGDVRVALARLHAIADGDFTALGPTAAEAAATALLEGGGPSITALGRAVLQCYYRDDRVLRALGLEARAPYPLGRTVPAGDWSLLDPVRGRPRLWRDVDGAR